MARPAAVRPAVGGTSRPGWRAVAEKFWGYFAAGNHPGRGWLLALAALVVVVLISAVGGTKNLTGRPLTGWAYVLTVLTMLLITFIVGLALRAGGTTLSALVKGSDNRTSTSKTQYVLWTVGVAFALAYISARTVLGPNTFVCDPNDKSPHNCVPDGPIWQQYLILLGVPAAAAVIAKATTTYQVSNGLIQTGQSEQATVSDVATDYSGQADLSDVQYLVFNIIAFLYFFAHFLHAGTFVSVPSLLLGLTSASAATYTLTKALQTSKPTISTVLPAHIVPDATVTVTGQNLFPAGATEATVLLGSLAVAAGQQRPQRGGTGRTGHRHLHRAADPAGRQPDAHRADLGGGPNGRLHRQLRSAGAARLGRQPASRRCGGRPEAVPATSRRALPGRVRLGDRRRHRHRIEPAAHRADRALQRLRSAHDGLCGWPAVREHDPATGRSRDRSQASYVRRACWRRATGRASVHLREVS